MMKQTLTAIAFVFSLSVSPALAGPIVLDQSYDAVASGSGGGSSIDLGQSVAQTFTVGIGGTLAQLDLQVQMESGTTGDLIINFLAVDNTGLPDIGQSLGSLRFNAGLVPPNDASNVVYTSFDVSPLNLAVAPGDVLAFEMAYDTNDGGGYIPFQPDAPPYYAGGGTSSRFNPNPYTSLDLDDDVGFQTYVEVPEPGSLALLGLGGLLIAWRRQR